MAKQPTIFLSYRRADSSEATTRLYDRLVYAFGRDYVFKDVDSLQRGDDFPEVLREWVSRCDVFLSIIGPRWLLVQDEHGRRRIDNPKDWVRQETLLALERGDGCLLIPTLVENAAMPDEEGLPKALVKLPNRNGHTLRPAAFHDDASALIADIRQRFGLVAAKPGIDLTRAYRSLAEMMKLKSYDAARDIIVAMRAQGSIPSHIPLDVVEKQLYKRVGEAERDTQYESVRDTAEMVKDGILPSEALLAALEAFWQSYDEGDRYDPDNLLQIAQPPVVIVVSSATPSIPLLEWIDIPAGDFLMGSDKSRDNQAYDDETPQHTATTAAYKIGKYPVTYAQYALFVANGGYAERTFWTDAGWDWKGDKTQPEVGWNDPDWHKDDHPVIGVTWYESAAFCNWLTAWLYPEVWGEHLRIRASRALHTVPGLIRLPTEAEWEKAARWDEKRKIALIYPYGDTYDPKKANTGDSKIGHTTAVTTYPNGISPYGVFDMSGNVWEWCLTKWRGSYEDKADEAPEGTDVRVLRGGSWRHGSQGSRAAYRSWGYPRSGSDFRGFRLVRS